MLRFYRAIAAAALVGLSTVAGAQTMSSTNGDDSYYSGAQVLETINAPGDTFFAGRSVQVGGTSQGDVHVAGYDVTISANTAEDLYAAGATVVVNGSVNSDLTVAAFSTRTSASSKTQGNARLAGNTVTVEGPVAGALSVLGRDVILNAPIQGDTRVVAQTLTFGPEAVINGTLTYIMPDKIEVPIRVAPSERVAFEKYSARSAWGEWEEISKDMPALPSFASAMFGFVVSLAFFLILGALMLTFMPKRLSRMRKRIGNAPGQTLLLGVIGLSMLIGMLPITAMTIVGLPFVPFVILAIIVAWVLGYALGAYSVGMRLWTGLGGDIDPNTIVRLLVFAGAIIAVALLNFIPFVGWVANFTLVLLGVGAMTGAIMQSLLGNPDVALDVDLKPIEDN